MGVWCIVRTGFLVAISESGCRLRNEQFQKPMGPSCIDARNLITVGLSATLHTGAFADDENASNPLSRVKNTDLRLQYFDLGDAGDRS